MVQIIDDPTHGSIFGRIGKGLGQGLAEQLPKEAERFRLSQGLQNLAQNAGNMTPLQMAAQYLPLLSNNPAALQILPALLERQGIRSNYANAATSQQGQGTPQTQISSQEQGLINQQGQPKNLGKATSMALSQLQNMPEQQIPTINPNNPLQENRLPAIPWTPQEKINEIVRLQDQFPNMSNEEIQRMARENEERSLQRPLAFQARDKQLNETKERVFSNFDNKLANILEKTDKPGIYEDISGENIQEIKRQIANELATNPNANEEELTNKWAKKARELARTKQQFNKDANTPLEDFFIPKKKTEYFDKLKSYSKIYADTGNSNEYFDELKNKLGLSPQAAANISYPLQNNISNLISNVNSNISTGEIASESAKKLSANDSLLSLAFNLKRKLKNFNQNEFFNYYRNNQDNLQLNDRQRRELAEGAGDILPNWADLKIYPNNILDYLIKTFKSARGIEGGLKRTR